jgi:hypothetical protein
LLATARLEAVPPQTPLSFPFFFCPVFLFTELGLSSVFLPCFLPPSLFFFFFFSSLAYALYIWLASAISFNSNRLALARNRPVDRLGGGISALVQPHSNGT